MTEQKKNRESRIKNQEKKGLSEEEIQEAIKKAEWFFVTQKVALFDRNTKKFLLILNANNNEWDLPGGLVDINEDHLVALKREVQEEIGVVEYDEISISSSLRTEYNLKGVPYPITILGYVACYKSGEIILSKEHSEFSWMTVEEIHKLTEKEIKPVMKNILESGALRLKEKEYLGDLQRVQADFENYRKRQIEAQKELKGMLIEKLVLYIVPVLDNFRSATEHVPEAERASPWVVGIQYIEKQLEAVLVDNGIQMIET